MTSWKLEAEYKISWVLASWKRAWQAGNPHKLEGGQLDKLETHYKLDFWPAGTLVRSRY